MKSIKLNIEKDYKGEIFKPDQEIICINNEEIELYFGNKNPENDSDSWNDLAQILKVGETYKVYDFCDFFGRFKVEIYIENYFGDVDWFYPDRFVSIKKYRKLKIKEIESK
jgi:hypothetical protein